MYKISTESGAEVDEAVKLKTAHGLYAHCITLIQLRVLFPLHTCTSVNNLWACRTCRTIHMIWS